MKISVNGYKMTYCTEWNEVSLQNIRAFGTTFDITVERDDGMLVKVYENGKEILSKQWDMTNPIEVRLSK